jgi:CRP-like cAMP-binding protein
LDEIQLNEIVETHRQTSLMGGFDPATLSSLLKQSEVLTLEDGSTLFRQGELGEAAYLVIAGEVEVIIETRLGTVSMATIGPSEIVGEISLFTTLSRTATVKAKGATQLLRLGRTEIATALANNSSATFGLIGAMGRRIDALNRPLVL